MSLNDVTAKHLLILQVVVFYQRKMIIEDIIVIVDVFYDLNRLLILALSRLLFGF